MRKLNAVLKVAGAEVFREIVPVALTSIISSLVLIPMILMVPIPFVPILIALLYMPLLYGVMYVFQQKAEGKPSQVRLLFTGAVKGFFPALIFGLLIVSLLFILWSTWWYYGSKGGMFYMSIAVFQTYFVLMALVSQFYTLQLVLQKGMGIFRAMAESVKLFFRFPGYTIGAFFQMVCFTFPLMLTVVGFIALFSGILGVYQYKAVHNVLSRDEEAEVEEAGILLTNGEAR
ncbi:hypothetical protein [Paenibacillus lutrae]|uniref:DUF624 domain-containing protein n=1 Tax=Paenibacillus lutrae TaxID=2078573 RepID=A0A7X3FMB3_9BACL|nr:hypothetical protein [Paenibacillus lutrae]MVP02366.1 hypothetical protein [Paenibacillus lutrae]